MEIRYIKQDDDLFEISNIYESSWKFAYQQIIPQDYLDSIPKGRWVNSLTREGVKHLVLIENGTAIGTASFCRSRWERYHDYGEIVSIYFLPAYMGKGYGSLLLKKCIQELRFRGYEKLLLWVLEDNQRARSFYEKHGFVCSEEYLNDNICGKEVREVMYVYKQESLNG